MGFPYELECTGITLTIIGVTYAHKISSKQSQWGELELAFDARDQDGREGVLFWEYAWEKRDVTRDALYTDRPEWVRPLANDDLDWPSAYHSDSEFENQGETVPDCTIKIRDEG